ncbi:hypothetical protein K469DRAFT_450358, partial [Zopfia rhizophila CBS 207.26]
TLQELGFAASTGASPIALVGPFRLFSDTTIRRMREELLSMAEKYGVEGKVVRNQMRGMVPEYIQAESNVWRNERTITRISHFAELDLVPVIKMEISQVNIAEPLENDTMSVEMHKDSYPFVCVVMLSDTTGMEGGETILKGPLGATRTLESLKMGWAYVLQGYHVAHAVKSFSGPHNRITAITSFRPSSPLVLDETNLGTVRSISHFDRLHREFYEYRVGMIRDIGRHILHDGMDPQR